MGVPPHRAIPPLFRPERLAIDWEAAGSTVGENLRTLLKTPRLPRNILLGPYFLTSIRHFNFPRRALAASTAWHLALIVFPFYVAPQRKPPLPAEENPKYQLTWYGPPKDLPRLAAPAPRARATPPKAPAPRPQIDAYHPRQTIVSTPKAPNHPRQTLIQPAAPQIAPKVLPPLPNIVQWSQPAQPSRPRLRIAPIKGPRVRVARAPTAPPEDLPMPQLPNQEKLLGELNIGASPSVPKPRMAIAPMSVPQPGPRQAGGESAPAPDVGRAAAGNGAGGISQIVALSANPAPPAPLVEIPLGNLQSRILISPDGPQPGVPGGAPNGTAGANGGSEGATGSPGGTGGANNTGAAAGPPGISISGGNPRNTAPVAGLGGAIPRPGVIALPAKPEPRVMPGEPGRTRPSVPAVERIQPGTPPEKILGPKRIHTMDLDAPNLTSATGSWKLTFAEMDDDGPGGRDSDLVRPEAIRKVDPKYPPALADAKIQGEVVLYAIIRRDGSVDSIQLVKGVDSQLDQNAMDALAKWRFRPAERRGQPVDLEAVIRIPFRPMARPVF